MTVRTLFTAGGPVVLSLALLAACGPPGTTGVAATAAAPQARTLSGSVAYSGSKAPHQVVIVATRVGEQAPAYSAVIRQLGAYSIPNVADGTYVVSAFMDMGDDMGPPGADEPSGVVDKDGDGKADQIVVKDGKGPAGLDIALRDPK